MNYALLLLCTDAVSTEIWFLFPGQDLECCGLPDPIGAHEAQHLPRARRRQTVQLEGVGTVAVSGVFLQVARQIDDGDGFEWTFLWKLHISL